MIEPIAQDIPAYYWLIGTQREHHPVTLPSELTDITEHSDWRFPDTLHMHHSSRHSSPYSLHPSPQRALPPPPPPPSEQFLLPHQLITRFNSWTLESREGRKVVANNFKDLKEATKSIQKEIASVKDRYIKMHESQHVTELNMRRMSQDIEHIKRRQRRFLEHYCSQHNLPPPSPSLSLSLAALIVRSKGEIGEGVLKENEEKKKMIESKEEKSSKKTRGKEEVDLRVLLRNFLVDLSKVGEKIARQAEAIGIRFTIGFPYI
ncbi:hypothetical protein L6452_17645 [Arctium lappa]|uniref:Uncharacterized protein n=1 Tax=Arctium lappa TaxID=4217 RepID=A0ACB9C3Z0_ARCLA|nr:hypothetical protein L6452_17645 [Arctium lappa]